MSDINLVDEEDLSLSANDLSHGGTADNSSEDNSTTSGKKAARKKGVKGEVKPVKAAKANVAKPGEAPVKKVTPKKASAKKVETIEPKPSKAKKTAPVKKQPVAKESADLPVRAKAIKNASVPKELTSSEPDESAIKPASSSQQQDRNEIVDVIPAATIPEDAEGKKSEAETKTSTISKITFQIKYSTVPGESLLVTGNHPLLGNNDAEKAFPLQYLDENYWFGTIEIQQEQRLSTDVSYYYLIKNIDGSISAEWGTDKLIKHNAFDSEQLHLIDTWNPSSSIENTFYTEAFTEVLLKENFTEVPVTTPSKVTHIFRAKAPLLAKGEALCIMGSVQQLGLWNVKEPMLLSKQSGDIWHSISLDLSNADFPINYKYGVFDTNTKVFVGYETGSNRVLNVAAPQELTVVSDGFAAVTNNSFKGAGVAIPVFSLRTQNGFGVGEFPDLKLMVDWAKQVGLKLVQLLPVNDTTATHTFTDSYPYAAISAFALHPLYLHLPSIVNKENQSLLASLKDVQTDLNSKSEVDYVEVMRVKWDLLKPIFPSQKQQTFSSPDFNAFFKDNEHWLVPYAAFSYFREQNKTADFNEWQTNQKFDVQQIKELAGSPSKSIDEISIYYFVQFHLHLQLKDATNYAHQNGIIVKGDIPIGIYRNSCDAWQEPELFHMDMQAGAPPDDFAVKGQNWGFPTYNWQRMREDGFTWWKKRFTQMSYYFDAFRIDHILGFFRIWSIPMHAVQGIMGHFVPAVPVHLNEIVERGIQFDYDRFCTPFINDTVLNQFFNGDIQPVISQFLNPSNDGRYKLKTSFDTQRKVEEYFARQQDNEQNRLYKEALFNLISNVIFFEADGSNQQEFHFRIAMADTFSYQHLDGNAKHHLYKLYVNYFFRRQDNYWQHEAMMKLPELKRSTNMLICGEDLGMVPDCVPGVMKELAILSLEIQRMPKNPAREFFHPNDAPYLSVVTPSTHDMSTIRGWWEEDRAATQRFFNNELGQWGTAPYFCEPWINRIILLQHLYSPAMWSIFQLQDLLGMSGELRRENPNEERINIPADPKHYWRYRMHIPIEQLLNEKEFTDDLRVQVSKSGR